MRRAAPGSGRGARRRRRGWAETACELPKDLHGASSDRLHYDAVDKVALLVVGSGAWAYRPPAKFAATGPADAGKGPDTGK